jgi:hypothetical protein
LRQKQISRAKDKQFYLASDPKPSGDPLVALPDSGFAAKKRK